MTTLEQRVEELERQIQLLQWIGYTCQICKIGRPKDWFIYEVEQNGEWVSPCCGICARKSNSRGPYKKPGDLTTSSQTTNQHKTV
jgi:hypothetical protein